MPRIFDNIDLPLLPTLKETLEVSTRADFCVGYFNLRGWQTIDGLVEPWLGGDGARCRLLVGMQPLPQDELRAMLSLASDDVVDQATVLQLKRRKAEEFREQLAFGAPTNADEAGLRRLSAQIRAGKVVVKLFLRHALHAKLYLLYLNNPINPIVGFLGSSNLTFAGLKKQGELNVDVLDHDACRKLQRWFEDRWTDKWCLDISNELADLIDSKGRFKWLPSALFVKGLRRDLVADARTLTAVLDECGAWDAGADTKLTALYRLLTERRPDDKVLVFTQFADTARYLAMQLRARGVVGTASVTGESADPTELAWRFSPASNEKSVPPVDELRVLIATDVLSEGQNLQDCAIIVNYDLPWAIVRLIQRAGRVDRIGQQAERILCYSFLPADGVERIIRLRGKVRQRLRENAEVVGTGEAFFDDDGDDGPVLDLYNEKAGILDGDADTEVDLSSYAYQIWKNAIDADPTLRKTIPDLPPVVYSTRAYVGTPAEPQGVLLYMRSSEGNDALAWVDREGRSVTESQLTILRAAACAPNTPAMPRHPSHHELVRAGAAHIVAEEQRVGGQLGRPSGARFRTYERLKAYADTLKGTLFASQELEKAIGEIYRYPLRQSAVDTLNRQLKSGADDETLARLVLALRDEDRLCLIHERESEQEPQIICSLGLFADTDGKAR